MARKPGLREQDVLAAVTTISFDIAGLESRNLPLLVGAAHLSSVQCEIAADGRELAERLTSSGATLVQATPADVAPADRSRWVRYSGLRRALGW